MDVTLELDDFNTIICKVSLFQDCNGGRVAQWLKGWSCNSRAPSSSPDVTAGFVLGSPEFKASALSFWICSG